MAVDCRLAGIRNHFLRGGHPPHHRVGGTPWLPVRRPPKKLISPHVGVQQCHPKIVTSTGTTGAPLAVA